MKRTWTVIRTLESQPDGQRRWDIAYQLLWQWTLEREAQNQSTSTDKQEEPDEDRTLHARINGTSTAESDD